LNRFRGRVIQFIQDVKMIATWRDMLRKAFYMGGPQVTQYRGLHLKGCGFVRTDQDMHRRLGLWQQAQGRQAAYLFLSYPGQIVHIGFRNRPKFKNTAPRI
jgi:hypothetical protein